MKKLLFITVALLFVNTFVYGEDIDAYIELLRSDVRTGKVAIITEAMDFTREESSVFWPIQRSYEAELSKILDERLSLIKDYARNYFSVTDEKAEELVKKSLKLEGKRTKLKKKYFKKLKKVIPATKAARFLQLENQIQRMIDLQISSQLPLIK
jgi:hypothetical protein